MTRILILMTEAGGGGHYASAEALRDTFHERFGSELQVEMVDLWSKYAPPPLRRVEQSYRFLVDDLPWLYRLLYEVGERPQVTEPLLTAAAEVLRPRVTRAIREHAPDLMVSVHPLVQQVVLKVLARMRRATPFVTVVTDLVTVPPVWFSREVALCFVPSDEAYRFARWAGLRDEQLRQRGLPIRPAFARQPRLKGELRQELGMEPEAPAALLVGGGEGMGPVGDIARAVATRLARQQSAGEPPVGQLVVVCGRNQRLHEEMLAHTWPVPTVVKGFVENIWDLMAACDCIITKAGPGTIAEACALGLPIVLSGYIPGQESGNVPYVLKNGVGVYAEDPWQIAAVVNGWFGQQRAILAQVAANALKLGRPQATFQIVDEIAALARAKGDNV
jgi:1,2-diacylglycerol 3-beta-galactosyltransferase